MSSPVHEADGGISPRTLEHLEWARLESAVLMRCIGPSARRRGLSFARTEDDARSALAETREASQLLAADEVFPLGELRDVEGHLERLAREGVLDAPALADLVHTLASAQAMRRFLGSKRAGTPALFAAATFDPSLDQLHTQLTQSIDPQGLLHDDASEELLRIRGELSAVRARITGRLQDLIDQHGDLLSDAYFTEREGRYVVPVRRDAHDSFPGIVHGSSASGASIFVEPRAVVAHGNQLKMLQSEHEREELRILTALSSVVSEHLAPLRAAVEALDKLDLRHASARLGRDIGGVALPMSAAGKARLVKARHPLLVLDGARVVGNDIEIDAGHALVISGPNAGGKTVVLKTLGLCALMLRCGLPLPVADGSELGFFANVLTEMGDEQSTATNLSTFSAHIRNLAHLLASTDARSLVLLDEVATGTDPAEGAALARALVEAFCARGAALVVTTHYEALKAAALHDPRMRTASVALEPIRMEPTFELLLGVPGASSALAVARRFGLPEEVIAAAERFVPEQTREFERMVAELHGEANALRSERASLAADRAHLATLERDIERRAADLTERSKLKLSKEAERIMTDLRQARSELDTARASIKRDDKSAGELSAIGKALSSVATQVGLGSEVALATAPLQARATTTQLAAPTVGARVYVPRLRSEAVVVEATPKGKVLVAVGAMKLWVEANELHVAVPVAAVEDLKLRAPLSEPAPMRSSDNTVDVRGLRVEDALAMLDSFIDRLYTGDARVGYVVHGHGTGALRGAIREHLERDLPYVQRLRPGEPDEGGDAVTTFYLV